MPSRAEPLEVFAAGSLCAAMTAFAATFAPHSDGTPLRLTLGASGLLKARICDGERAHVFTSANTDHPQALHTTGLASGVRVFARNQLGILATADFALHNHTLAERLLDKRVRVGISAPGADPSGDYA